MGVAFIIIKLPSTSRPLRELLRLPLGNPRQSLTTGGEGGIRTHDTLARIPVFETGPFNRSGTSPEARILADSQKGCVSRLVAGYQPAGSIAFKPPM